MLDHLTSRFSDAIIAEVEEQHLDFVITFDRRLKMKIPPLPSVPKAINSPSPLSDSPIMRSVPS
jgi:hypothetical protein